VQSKGGGRLLKKSARGVLARIQPPYYLGGAHKLAVPYSDLALVQNVRLLLRRLADGASWRAGVGG
jgi:hypothetical protein